MIAGFSPYPTLVTERLVLRKLAITDLSEIFSIRSDQEVNQFIERPRPRSLTEAEEFIINIHKGIAEERCLYWAITLKGLSKLIGTICLWNFSSQYIQAELGYELLPAYQGRGYIYEATQAVIQYGFVNISLNRIEAYTHKKNLRSIQLLLKNGFTLEQHKIDDEHPANLIFALTNMDSQNSRGS